MAEDQSRITTTISQIDSNTSIKLTTMLFNGKNYLPWARAVTISLKGKGKFGHVDGSKKKPEKDPEKEEWEMHDNLIMSWLLNSMEPSQCEIFVYCDSSHEIWMKMKKMFARTNNFAHIFQLKQDIAQIKQGSKSITEFYGAIKAKWDELDIHVPDSTDLEKIRERKEQDRIFQLLANLDPSFELVRTQILLNPILPSLDSVIATLEQEESRRKAMNSENQPSKAENQAFLSKGRPYSNLNPRVSVKAKGGEGDFCDNCKKEGHTKDRCWFLHPHLRPGNRGGGDRKGGGGNQQERKKCFLGAR
jgi:gag-polypeptide of LTR copia-type